jgi:hypothetical protein
MSLFRKNSQPETTTADPDVLMRFLTIGGATVELRSHQFKTRYQWDSRSRVFPNYETRTVDGYRWQCLGCGKLGAADFNSTDYLDHEHDRARDDANSHASACRAMPR